jgi:hypothetical protein
MSFIKMNFLFVKRNNINCYEKFLLHLIDIASQDDLLKDSYFPLREGIWKLTKSSQSILLEPSGDCIYWKGALPR